MCTTEARPTTCTTEVRRPAGALVVAYSGDPASRRTLGFAAGLARNLGLHMHVVYGLETHDHVFDARTSDWATNTRTHLSARRHDLQRILAGSGVSWTYHISTGNPDDVVADIAGQHDTQMIVTGTPDGGALTARS